MSSSSEESQAKSTQAKKRPRLGRLTDVKKKLLAQSNETVNSIKRRRPRKSEEDATFHYNSYDYKVRAKREDVVIEFPVCSKAFVSVHGITKKRREVIQRYLKEGVSPKDRHKNRKNRLKDLNATKMHNHFRERYPNLNVSYQKFKEKLNIKFGYPRTDTCSVCDEFVTEVESLKTKVLNVPVSDNEHKLVEKKIQDLIIAN
ncbi:hypothetical protein ANN_22683 [Periplaneta americana]|uniref:Uncharacterized protein n=1 Tax=Periplaneta americana TaxID=6978 RepID=A0ABQ8S8T3_PERAM|nr:hypothetical protein ANN_22683 [Periplaneta americana]